METKVCETDVTGQDIRFCQAVDAVILAGGILGSEAILLLDRKHRRFVREQVLSVSLREILSGKDIYDTLDELNVFEIINKHIEHTGKYVADPYQSYLSMNVCLDNSRRQFYVNLQALPLRLPGGDLRYVMCSLRFAAKPELDLLLVDTQASITWRYSSLRKSFEQEESQRLSAIELDLIRLTRLGYKTQELANALGYSAENIKYHRQRICNKLQVANMEEVLAFVALHHLL